MLKWLRRGGPGAPECGLDLGSSRARLVSAGGPVAEEATALLWDLSSNAALEHGDRAWERRGRFASHCTLLRPVRNGTLADFDAAEALCRALQSGLKTRPHVLAAAAATSGEPELQVWGDMLRESGAAAVTLVPATACAMIGNDAGAWSERIACAVLEAGAEVLQASVYSRGRAVFHWGRVGGARELELHLADHFLRRHFLEVGSNELGRLLPQLCLNATRSDDSFWLEVKGKDLQSGLPRTLSVAHWELDHCLELCVEPLREMLTALTEETPPELLQHLLEDGIGLSGGFAGLNGLSEHLQAQLGLPVVLRAEPAGAVARGLSRILAEPRAFEALLS